MRDMGKKQVDDGTGTGNAVRSCVKAGKKDAKLETKKANNCALNPNNEDGHDSRWEHANKASQKPVARRHHGVRCRTASPAKWCHETMGVTSAIGVTTRSSSARSASATGLNCLPTAPSAPPFALGGWGFVLGSPRLPPKRRGATRITSAVVSSTGYHISFQLLRRLFASAGAAAAGPRAQASPGPALPMPIGTSGGTPCQQEPTRTQTHTGACAHNTTGC
jgi:hypothetical protein